MNVLILGSGGREHALAVKVRESELCKSLYVAPGNGGTSQIATNVVMDITEKIQVVEFCRKHRVGFVIIGPEAPLVAGIANELRANDILVFGPNYDGAMLEGSKRYAKQFMAEYKIPTARYESFTELAPALGYLEDHPLPIVVKADGLASGKGVTVAHDLETARNAVMDSLTGRFGDAGRRVVIETFLEGPEVSLMCLVSDKNMVPLAPARDYKRIGEDDTGANTGGMGALCPIPDLLEDDYRKMVANMQRAVEGLQKEGFSYRGVLYGGFIITNAGPMVLEFNVRFGDPETQVIIPRLGEDLLAIMIDVAQGRLTERPLVWKDQTAVTVVMASGGYPEEYEVGYPITGIEESLSEDLFVYHAGTKLGQDNKILTDGGRVLNVTGLGKTTSEAREKVYEACNRIDFQDEYYRTDIALEI